MTTGSGLEYDANYYASHLGTPYQRSDEWLRFFGNAADRIVASLGPSKVLDVGCAFGFLVEALRDRGVDAFGTDVSEYAISQVGGSAVGHCVVRSALQPILQRYDLITCIEVVEHLSPEDGREALRLMTEATDRLLLSSTPYDHAEPTHLNVQPVEYWASILAEFGFFRDVDLDVSYMTSWAGVFVRRSEPFPTVVKDYERYNFRTREELIELRRARNSAAAAEAEAVGAQAAVVELQQELLVVRDAVVAAEAERGVLAAQLAEAWRDLSAAKTDQENWDRMVEGNLGLTPAEMADRLNLVQQRLDDVETSTTWRVGWAALSPYRWLRSRL